MDVLFAFVFLLEGPLHVKVELALALDSLLFHIADDTFVHSLWVTDLLTYAVIRKQSIANSIARNTHTSFSDLCWKWTNTIVLAAKSDVPIRVSFEARDMVYDIWRCSLVFCIFSSTRFDFYCINTVIAGN